MKRMQQQLKWWLVVVVASLASIVQAEDVTVTTYYPSPRGNYQTLSTTGSTTLATDPLSGVGIGGPATGVAKLEVIGDLRVQTTPPPSPDHVLRAVDATGRAQWVDLGTLGVVTGPGTPTFIPLWTSSTNLGNSVIQEVGGNIGIGAPPGPFLLDVAGTERIVGSLTLEATPVCEELYTVGGVVTCRPLGDISTTNEFNEIHGGDGLSPDNAFPPSVTLSVNTGPGIIITGDQVTLANPSLTCPPAATTRAIHDFDLRNGVVNCVDAGGGAGPGFTGTLSTIDPDVTLLPNPWDPDSGLDATISVSAAASPLPSGSAGDTLRNTAAGVNWVASGLLYNNGLRIGIGTPLPSQLLDVSGNINASGNMNIGAASTYQRGGTPGVSLNCTPGNTPSGLTISGGIVTSTGACAAIGGSGSVGPGTANFVAKFNAAGTNVVNSLIFDNGTNVGIGT
ncbi:MAG: hypothetical protein Q8R78_06170, partial [Candidatus Omnitrophota bacterium]|nr:hypothetical protein [Candidatus Omnitrophota bacterium]